MLKEDNGLIKPGGVDNATIQNQVAQIPVVLTVFIDCFNPKALAQFTQQLINYSGLGPFWIFQLQNKPNMKQERQLVASWVKTKTLQADNGLVIVLNWGWHMKPPKYNPQYRLLTPHLRFLLDPDLKDDSDEARFGHWQFIENLQQLAPTTLDRCHILPVETDPHTQQGI